MKRTPSCFAIIAGLFLSAYAAPVQAQLLKKLLNDVKQTAQNRAENKTDQATNKALDKVDSATQIKSGRSGDTSAIHRVLGGFAKAAQDNPNDTSMSDLLAKSLGNMMGGNGVSASDSAQTIQAFKITGGGSTPGVYYEITNSVTAKNGNQASTITKEWFTGDGRARGEMDVAGLMAAMMGQKINSKPIVTISRSNMPIYSITLDDDAKTYSLNVIDTSLINEYQDKYQAKMIGNETIENYHCTHVKLISKKQNIDVWTSKEVPGFTIYQKLTSSQAASAIGGNMLSELKSAGADGIMVKISIVTPDASEVMLLTKAQLESGISYNYFVIPPEYAQAKNNGIITNLMQAGQGGK